MGHTDLSYSVVGRRRMKHAADTCGAIRQSEMPFGHRNHSRRNPFTVFSPSGGVGKCTERPRPGRVRAQRRIAGVRRSAATDRCGENRVVGNIRTGAFESHEDNAGNVAADDTHSPGKPVDAHFPKPPESKRPGTDVRAARSATVRSRCDVAAHVQTGLQQSVRSRPVGHGYCTMPAVLVLTACLSPPDRYHTSGRGD